MFRFILLLLILLPVNVFAFECNQRLDDLSEQYEVPIYCNSKSIESEERFTYEEADQRLIDAATPVIEKFFHTYNKNFLGSHLRSVNLFKNIKHLGVEVGGMSDGHTIWLCLDDYSNREIERVYLKALHHEFSSNVYKNVRYSRRVDWKKINYIYDYSIAYLKTCLSNFVFCSSTSDKLLSEGFLRNYSLTNDENDFNVYAETLFTKPNDLKALGQKYPLIAKKIQMLKSFYREVGFTGKFPDEP